MYLPLFLVFNDNGTFKQISKVIWQKAASPFCHPYRRQMHSSAGQAHLPAAAGEPCAMYSCVSTLQWGLHMYRQSAPFRGDDVDPIK